jgi:hypothetical protein
MKINKLIAALVTASSMWVGAVAAAPVVVQKGNNSVNPIVTNMNIYGVQENGFWTSWDPRAEVDAGVVGDFKWTFCAEPFVDDTPAGFLPGVNAIFDKTSLSNIYLEKLYGAFYSSLIPNNGTYSNGVNVAAFQVLVWEFVIDSTSAPNLTAGSIQITAGTDTNSLAVQAQAQAWLNTIVGDSNNIITRPSLVFYDGVPGGVAGGTSSAQGQGFIGVGPPNNGDPVLPIPAIPALLAAGALALAASRRK